MLNKYNRIARIYPTVLCSLPVFILNYFLLASYTNGLVTSLSAVTWVGGVSFSAVVAYLFGQIGRFLGKEFFEKRYFNDELNMPTTNHLLHSDSFYTPDFKKRIHLKIFTDFGLVVHPPQEEERDTVNARKIIVESVGLIRAKVKDGRLVLKHNYEYGFVRNLIGGSLVGLFVSVLNLFLFGYFSPNNLAFGISVFLALVYLGILLMAGYLIRWHGVRYAKILIQEYLVFM